MTEKLVKRQIEMFNKKHTIQIHFNFEKKNDFCYYITYGEHAKLFLTLGEIYEFIRRKDDELKRGGNDG